MNITRTSLLSPILLILLLCSSTLTHAAGQELNGIVAVVDDTAITRYELEQRVNNVRARFADQPEALPEENILRRKVLEQMVIERIQLELAERTGIRIADDKLNEVIQGIAAQNGITLQQLRDTLEADGISYARYREQLRDDLIINQLREREVDNRISISQQEIDEAVRRQQALAGQGKEYHLGHILVAIPEAASPEQVAEAESKARELLGQLRAGANFRNTAIANSDGRFALEGGDLGWRRATQLSEGFARVVTQMQPGQVSDVLRSANGFHILKLLEVRGEQRHITQQVHARHILLTTRDGLSNFEARSRLSQLRQRILAGEDFATLAQAHSHDGSAANGGDLGWNDPAIYVPAFRDMLGRLTVGEVSEPFQSQFGWHIVEVLGRRNFDDTEGYLRSQALSALKEQRIDERLESWLRRLREESFVEYRLDH